MRVWPLVLAACMPCTLSGCAALKEANDEANNDWAEVWESTKNLMRPDQVGCASPRAVEIDKRLKAQGP